MADGRADGAPAVVLSRSHGRPRVDDRRGLSGIIFVDRNGLRWRDAPKDYGPAKTLYDRWKRWGEMGVFVRMMAGLAAPVPHPSCASDPSTSVASCFSDR